jgi:hypothetical protein
MRDFFFQIVLFVLGLIVGIVVPHWQKEHQRRVAQILGFIFVATALIWTGYELGVWNTSSSAGQNPTSTVSTVPVTNTVNTLITDTTATSFPATNSTHIPSSKEPDTNWAVSFEEVLLGGKNTRSKIDYDIILTCAGQQEKAFQTIQVSNEVEPARLGSRVYFRMDGVFDRPVGGARLAVIHSEQSYTPSITITGLTQVEAKEKLKDCRATYKEAEWIEPKIIQSRETFQIARSP